ncbi:hypothetical protein TrRE_jg10406 [Triparma retinervis]|uniref:Uncharacterized protein n=1 Tax=Triparma retinervis TaxID=2557542 RepID=A0A9W7E3X5_9STRA|nr:hypothetical protein TrRE_jg10406 [Triparma retinervis]
MDIYGDNSGPLPVGANLHFRTGMGIVTQQFDSEKEAKLLQIISRREGLLEGLVSEAKKAASYKPYDPLFFVTSLISLRHATTSVIMSLLSWRSGLVNPEPFTVAGTNYLLKVIGDLAQARQMPTVELFGMELGLRNPFCLPCKPRGAVRKAIKDTRRKQALEKKKREKMKVQGIEVKWEAIPIDHEMHEAMTALSTVDEEHWHLMLKCERVLRDEEERFGKKVDRAGTGWGMERWTKMFWKPNRVNAHQNNNHNHNHSHDHQGEHGKGEGGEDGEEDGEGNRHDMGQEPQQQEKVKDHHVRAKTGAPTPASATASGPNSKPSKSRRKKKGGSGMSKEERAKAMAAALQEERIEMERRGRGVVGTEDIRRALKGEPAQKKAQHLHPGDKKDGDRRAAKHKKDAAAANKKEEGGPSAAPGATSPDHFTLPQVGGAQADQPKKKGRKSRGSATPADSNAAPAKLPRHGGRQPPQELWDFDPSIEILSVGGGEEPPPQSRGKQGKRGE